jgi:geranylgeranyl pyrophosphate synthase
VRPTAQFADAELQREFETVQRHLAETLAELQPPLSELVRSQLAESLSPQRVGVLLAAGMGRSDTLLLAEQRILLAAALEMLRLALVIHGLLLRQEWAGEQTEERSWLGSVILAGDYCFSRSAVLAARTDEPQVVAIFADALKTVSEGQLRQLFEAQERPLAEDDELIDAGLLAATVLAGQGDEEAGQTIRLGRELLHTGYLAGVAVTPSQQRRWQAVQALIAASSL